MAVAKPFDRCALVMGVLSSLESQRDRLFDILRKDFGPILKVSEAVEFSYTDYYDDEMGTRPVRYLIMFSDLVNPEDLAKIKTRTNEIEKLFCSQNIADETSSASGRRINLDPGILSLSSFILATCKNRSHRIPLRDGIYAETTLIYEDHDFKRLSWTYADYSSDEIRATLRDFRDCYKRLLKQV